MTTLTNYRRESTLTGLWHDYANLFPMLDAAPQDALRGDIEAHGVREPVILFGGRILDGRNRYMAARDLGLDFPVVDFDGSEADALAYVLSTNLHRRHLTESQRSTVGAKLANMTKSDAGRLGALAQDKATANLQLPENASISQAQAADMLNVSERSVATAKKMMETAAPELVAAVERGDVSVSAAAAVSGLPKDEQIAAVAEGPKAVQAKAKEVREAKKAAPPESKPDQEPVDPETAKVRRELAKLTPEAVADEVIGLRADLTDAKAKLAKQKSEIADLKGKLADHTSDDKDEVIRRLSASLKNAESAKWHEAEKTQAAMKQVYGLKKRVDELQEMGIALN